MTAVQLDIDAERLAGFCRRHCIARLSLFGSALRNDFRADSDIDFLVEFLPGSRVSLLDIGGMNMELAEMVGREVDLRTPGDLSPYFRDEVVRSARPIYVA